MNPFPNNCFMMNPFLNNNPNMFNINNNNNLFLPNLMNNQFQMMQMNQLNQMNSLMMPNMSIQNNNNSFINLNQKFLVDQIINFYKKTKKLYEL